MPCCGESGWIVQSRHFGYLKRYPLQDHLGAVTDDWQGWGALPDGKERFQRDSNVGCCLPDGINLNCSGWFQIPTDGHETSMLVQNGKIRRGRLPLESFTQRLPRARRTPAIMTLEKQWFQMAGERRFLQGLRKTAPQLRESSAYRL